VRERVGIAPEESQNLDEGDVREAAATAEVDVEDRREEEECAGSDADERDQHARSRDEVAVTPSMSATTEAGLGSIKTEGVASVTDARIWALTS